MYIENKFKSLTDFVTEINTVLRLNDSLTLENQRLKSELSNFRNQIVEWRNSHEAMYSNQLQYASKFGGISTDQTHTVFVFNNPQRIPSWWNNNNNTKVSSLLDFDKLEIVLNHEQLADINLGQFKYTVKDDTRKVFSLAVLLEHFNAFIKIVGTIKPNALNVNRVLYTVFYKNAFVVTDEESLEQALIKLAEKIDNLETLTNYYYYTKTDLEMIIKYYHESRIKESKQKTTDNVKPLTNIKGNNYTVLKDKPFDDRDFYTILKENDLLKGFKIKAHKRVESNETPEGLSVVTGGYANLILNGVRGVYFSKYTSLISTAYISARNADLNEFDTVEQAALKTINLFIDKLNTFISIRHSCSSIKNGVEFINKRIKHITIFDVEKFMGYVVANFPILDNSK